METRAKVLGDKITAPECLPQERRNDALYCAMLHVLFYVESGRSESKFADGYTPCSVCRIREAKEKSAGASSCGSVERDMRELARSVGIVMDYHTPTARSRVHLDGAEGELARILEFAQKSGNP